MSSTDTMPHGSITDITGIRVGHHQRAGRGWQSGTTVIIADKGATPGVDVRGGGPGTRETDALAPENLIEAVHAICLTGGSAYGLAAADGVMEWLEAQGKGFPVIPATEAQPARVVPIVPAAVIFDLGRGGVFTNRPTAEFGTRAASKARSRQTHWGAVGAGTGAKAGVLQGGVGTASTTVCLPTVDGESDQEIVVGALAVVNANGSVFDRDTGMLWEQGDLKLRRPSPAERRAIRVLSNPLEASRLNTTIGVVATSARLTKAEVSKLASVAHDGLARAIRPAHSMFDGDTIFGLATGQQDLRRDGAVMGDQWSRPGALNQLLVAAADTFAAACAHAVVSATTIGAVPAYCDVCPTAVQG